MKFELTKPCANCPFRKDKPFHLCPARAEEIVDSLTRKGQTFPCHKTTEATGKTEKDHQHCAGALIMLEKTETRNQMVLIAERLGMYSRKKLDMESPVYETPQEFIQKMRELDSRVPPLVKRLTGGNVAENEERWVVCETCEEEHHADDVGECSGCGSVNCMYCKKKCENCKKESEKFPHEERTNCWSCKELVKESMLSKCSSCKSLICSYCKDDCSVCENRAEDGEMKQPSEEERTCESCEKIEENVLDINECCGCGSMICPECDSDCSVCENKAEDDEEVEEIWEKMKSEK